MTMDAMARSLVGQIEATQVGEPWYGSSRVRLLAGLTAEQAAAHPIPAARSIWELVLHMIAWTREVTRRIQGQPPAEPIEGDWPAVPTATPQAWADAQSELAAAHAALLAAVATMPDQRWHQVVGESREPALGTGVDVAGMLVGLAQHDAYHTGQLVIVRRALDGASPT
jgi:uncharacterized damage-inducible protein DinB